MHCSLTADTQTTVLTPLIITNNLTQPTVAAAQWILAAVHPIGWQADTTTLITIAINAILWRNLGRTQYLLRVAKTESCHTSCLLSTRAFHFVDR